MDEQTADIRGKPQCFREDAEAVVRKLRAEAHVAYFAGGCVRDLLMGLRPKDYDVATDAPPKRVRQLFINTQAVGQAFGVILVRLGRSVIEVATFRSDGAYEDGRRPATVYFTSPEEDAKRRDFTINGLFMDPLEGDRVIDYVGGREDIEARRLRAIGNPGARFAEDHLRLLRAVRFAARFGLEIEKTTAEAIARDAAMLKRISPERVGDELRLMLTPATRNVAWELLWRFGLVGVVFRFAGVSGEGKLEPLRSIFMATAPGGAVSMGLALAAASLDVHRHVGAADVRPLLERAAVGKMVQAMRQGLKISNEESEGMRGTLEGIAPLIGEERPRVAALKRFMARGTSGASRHLLDALDAVGLYRERVGWLRGELALLDGVDCAPLPLVNGDDLTAAGLTPGPVFKRVLEETYDAQLEGRVKDRDGALAYSLARAR